MRAKSVFVLAAAAALAGSFSAARAQVDVPESAEEAVQQGAEGVQEGVAQQRNLGRQFDPKTVETVSGEVAEVQWIRGATGVTESQHIVLKTDQEKLTVVLGPQSFLDTQNVKINRGDRVEVTGSRIIADQKPVIIASQVNKGGQTLTLRDRNGRPLWTEGRRQPQ